VTEPLESWESGAYAVEWASDDVLAALLELPRRISTALVSDSDLAVRHIVDLGSGQGTYLERFLRAFPEATGTWVDANEAMRDLARERLYDLGDRVRYVLADVERLEAVDVSAADVVTTSRVFHHFSAESLQRVYRAAYELLRPGGFLFNLDHVGAPGEWDRRYRRIRDEFTGPRKRELKPHRHDYPLAGSDEHLRWIADAGFELPDIAWRTFYTVLLVARRAPSDRTARRAGSASAK
jgi:SAM-dependent methyltransferase